MGSLAVSASQLPECIPSNPSSPEDGLRNMCQGFLRSEDLLKIIKGYKSGWQGFFENHPLNQELCIQTHGIKGLKVYRDGQTKELVADIALKEIGHGDYKKAKLECKVFANGIVQYKVCYRCLTSSQEDKINFLYDIKNELMMRRIFKGTPTILPLRYSGSYFGRCGYEKKRYEAPFCGVLLNFARSSQDKKTRIQSLCMFLEALTALQKMHHHHFIHKDFKPDNIFFEESHGFLADLGCAEHIHDPCLTRPSRAYKSAEARIFGCNREIEMFSVGASLLQIFRPDLWWKFENFQYNFWIEPEKIDQKMTEEWEENIRKLQQELGYDRSELSALSQLISELIDPAPETRPTCKQAIARLREIIYTQTS
jgi:serine/threonine protein kinase